MAHEEEILGKAYDAKLMRRLVAYLRPYRWKVVLAVIITIAVSALGPLRPYLTMIAIDDYIAKGNYNGLIGIVAWIVASLVFQSIVQYAQTVVTQWIGQQTVLDLRQELFAHLQKLSMRFFDRNPVGRLVTRLTNDVEVLSDLFSSGIIMIVADIFVIFWIFVFMFATSWKLSLVVLTVFPLLMLATSIFRKKARESYREVRLLVARVNAFLNEHVSGMITVQLFGHEAHTYRQFDQINHATADANIRSVFYYAVFYPAVEFLSSVATALIVWYGGSLAIGYHTKPTDALTIGTLVAFYQYTEQFFRPIRDLADKYNILQSAMAASERIFRLLDDQTMLAEPAQAAALGAAPSFRARGQIEFRNVWFAYNNEDFVLKNISFSVMPGQTVAFVGATGAGKSSIANLMTRLYEFQQGEILIDGVDIRLLDSRDLRRNIAIVLQDVFLFSADVATNISLGNTEISQERIRAAAQTVGANDFISRLPRGLESQVKERGAILSVGEKQLISFARALAYDPSILILDEATSSIDTHSEQLIQHAIDTLLEGRTSIVIAHRLSTIQKADKIIVLHKGEIREQGTHDELLKMGGLYRTLYELQYKEQEVAAKAA
ncbi:MAG TPA: ABC transporter ATP-binding protein [Candidatus Kapabacteria bacterium]|jgi:ATP-binding cassette subfamily B protein|nr:ABC transporter ATP-binding protein [Candidatus Kapabacteria bacterium]